MSIITFIVWLVGTIIGTAVTLEAIGRSCGAHVAMDASTRFATFIGIGTLSGLAIGAGKWLLA